MQVGLKKEKFNNCIKENVLQLHLEGCSKLPSIKSKDSLDWSVIPNTIYNLPSIRPQYEAITEAPVTCLSLFQELQSQEGAKQSLWPQWNWHSRWGQVTHLELYILIQKCLHTGSMSCVEEDGREGGWGADLGHWDYPKHPLLLPSLSRGHACSSSRETSWPQAQFPSRRDEHFHKES